VIRIEGFPGTPSRFAPEPNVPTRQRHWHGSLLLQSADSHLERDPMKTLATAILFAGGLALCASACTQNPEADALAKVPAAPVGSAEGYAADNSGANARDRADSALTATDQANTRADIEITQTIRQAVIADKDLSTNAHNIKIISANGIVTLRGPVKDTAEKEDIGAKAQQVAGVTRVDNQIEIATE